MTLVGRQDSPRIGQGHVEEIRWIGKPWRRVELLTNRFFWKGEQVDVTRDLTFHAGLRRLGLAFTFTVIRTASFDYTDEPQ